MDPTPTPVPVAAPAASSGPSPRVWIWLLALVPAAVAVLQLGRLHPDEVYQSLEPAFWRVHGYGVLSWEWQSGLRNWLIPGVLAGFLWVSNALGIDHPRIYRAIVELPILLLHAWALWAAYRYLARRSVSTGALPGLLALGLYGPIVAFGGRTLSESISTAFLFIAVEALDRATRDERWEGLLGGFALGMAVATRYPSAVIVLAALAWLVLRRRWKTLYYAIFSGLAVAALLGLLDWATWGKPFHSMRQYLAFNVFSDLAARSFGREPWWWYFPFLAGQLPAWAWVAIPFAVMKPGNRLGLPLFGALVYFVVISMTPHKELRFLYPVLALLTLFGAAGLSRIYELLRHRWLKQIAFALTLLAGFLPFFMQGEVRGDQFRAIVRATRSPDARGLLIMGEGIWGAGGYFYVGKNIPWMVADWPRDGSYRAATSRPHVFNRIVTYDRRAETELLAAGYQVTERIGRATVMVHGGGPRPP